MMPFSATAQDDTPDIPAGWEIGIESPQDTEPIFQLGLDGEVSVKFWIDNQNLAAINLDIEFDIPFDGSVNGPETVEIGAQSNKSFEFTIHQIDVSEFAASQSDRFIVTGTVTGYAGLPLTTGGDSKDGEGNITIPMVVDLTIDLAEPTGPLNAGTISSLEVIVRNEGNAVDSVYKVTVTDSCPLLDVGGAEELESVAIEMGNNLTQILNISTSDSHPTKNCVIEISIQSRGDIDAGRSQTADSDESTVSRTAVITPMETTSRTTMMIHQMMEMLYLRTGPLFGRVRRFLRYSLVLYPVGNCERKTITFFTLLRYIRK